MRTSGPCIRCNTIRMNLDNNVRVEDCEPYRTLSTFRNVPGLGILFGMYYQMDVLETDTLYRSSLPSSLGYLSKAQSEDLNPVELREGDGQYYVTIRKDDGIIVRCEKEFDWVHKFKAPEVFHKK